ncbi:MAG: ABC transporter permease [Acidobacteriota bacterium]
MNHTETARGLSLTPARVRPARSSFRLFRLARHAAGALWAQKGKAFLMLLGTAVGIMLLTAVVGLSAGVERRISEIMSTFGPRSIMVFAGGGRMMGPPGRSASSSTLRLEDAAAVRDRFSEEAVICAGLFQRDVPIKAGEAEAQTDVTAADPAYCQTFDWYVSAGEPLDEDDERTLARRCVLGTTVARNLFGDEDPVGQRILVNRVQFTVKGVLQSRGTNSMGFDMDDRIWVPLSTGMRRVFRVDTIRFIRLKVREGYEVPSVVQGVTALLRQRHHVREEEEDDFRVRTPDFIAQRVRSMARTTQLVGGALTLVALLVGGVVLMNILLLSVSERVPEIGLKRALGASRRDVFSEFLVESVIVSLFGMALGVLLGLVPVLAIPKLFPMMPMAVSWKTFAYAALFSSLVGLVFGVQPARRAARLDPVEALR